MTVLVPTHIQCKTKVKCLCVIVLLSLPLTMGDVPGPCRHSITGDHLLTVRRLTDNQLQSGCSITYTFIEQRRLSKCCYVKAALPRILELLDSHFKYTRGSDNHSYVQSLKALVHNIYSQRCVPQINEELEDDPVSFEKAFRGSPSEALGRAQDVLAVYLELVTTNDTPVDWNCQREYAETLETLTEPPRELSIELHTDLFTKLSTELPFTTGRALRKSAVASQASQTIPNGDLYKFGFIVASVCGALLFMFTVYCLVAQKKTHKTHHRSQLNSRLHTYVKDMEMNVQ